VRRGENAGQLRRGNAQQGQPEVNLGRHALKRLRQKQMLSAAAGGALLPLSALVDGQGAARARGGRAP
jgi:hypothetical protein